MRGEWRVGLAMCALALAACGGGDETGGGPVELVVFEVTPADGASDIELDATVSVTFNQAIDPESAGGQVTLDGVPATMTVDHAVVTLTPDAPLAFLTDYRITVGTGLRGLAGGTLAAPKSYTFTSRARRWSSHMHIGTSPPNELTLPVGPQLAGGVDGRVVALWQTGQAADDLRVQWNAYDPATDTWRDADDLAVSTTPTEAQLASDGDGQFLAAWIDSGRSAVRIGWIDPTSGAVDLPDPLYTTDTIVSGLALAMSRSGDAAIAYLAQGGLRVSRLVAANGLLVSWAVEDPFDPSAGGLFARWFRGGWQDTLTVAKRCAVHHPLAIDRDGNAIAVYHEGAASYYVAARDEWIESEHGLDDVRGLAVALSGSDPIAMGTANGTVLVSIYR